MQLSIAAHPSCVSSFLLLRAGAFAQVDQPRQSRPLQQQQQQQHAHSPGRESRGVDCWIARFLDPPPLDMMRRALFPRPTVAHRGRRWD